MTKKISLIAASILISLIFCQCQTSREEKANGLDYPSQETFRQIDVCMGYMNSDPLLAHHMLDSLRAEGLMTQARCDYFHAMVIFGGENQYEPALAICDSLLNEGKFGDDPYLEEEICVLASNITQGAHRHLETLEYANRGIAICHGVENMRKDEATLMARVGTAEQSMGHIDKAIETFSRARALLNPSESFADIVALIALQRKQASLYRQSKEYDKVIGGYREILDLVERFDRDPSFVQQRPENMLESGDGTHDFANFYKSQFYGYLALAFHDKIRTDQSLNPQADKDSVRLYYEKWLHTEGSQSPDYQTTMMRVMFFLGEKSEFEQAKSVAEEFYRGDSLISDYLDYLNLLARDEASKGNYKACSDYQQRALVVSDSIRQHELMQELSAQMSINMVQEQQLARQDAERLLKQQRLINILLSTVLGIIVIATLIITFLTRKNRENQQIIEKAHHDLNEAKEDVEKLAQQLEQSNAEKAAMHSALTYERIEKAMSDEKLYLDPELDIIKLSKAVGSSRSSISACINHTTGKSFRLWLSEYRLSLFVKKLGEASETTTINEIAYQCGYKDLSTFRRQFKTVYGMTAREYRDQLTTLYNNETENINVNKQQEALDETSLQGNSDQ